MNDWTKRFAVSALAGFAVFFFALPVSCCGFVLYNEHLYGDVQSGGPGAILRAMGTAFLLALVAAAWTWRRSSGSSGPRGGR